MRFALALFHNVHQTSTQPRIQLRTGSLLRSLEPDIGAGPGVVGVAEAKRLSRHSWISSPDLHTTALIHQSAAHGYGRAQSSRQLIRNTVTPLESAAEHDATRCLRVNR